MENFFIGISVVNSNSASLLHSLFSGLTVQSMKLPDIESNPASDTDDRRFPELIGVPSTAIRDKRFRFL